MGVSLNVQVFRGGQPLGSHQFDSDTNRTIKIGRLPSAQLKLEDPLVSRIHAVIEFSGQDVSLTDMGSGQGTAVNGAKVHRVKLSHGDQVLIGDTQLVIGFGQAAVFAPPQAAATVGGTATVNMAMPPQPRNGMPAANSPTAWTQPAAQPAHVLQSAPAPQPMPAFPAAAAGSEMRFDPGTSAVRPIQRITQERLRSAAIESKPHPALAPEEAMSAENRVLEMRVYWGTILLNIEHRRKPKAITIGETKNTNVFISSEGLPKEEFPLIRTIDDEYVLTFTNAMDGEIEIAGQVQPLSVVRGTSLAQKDSDMEGSYQVRLPQDARAIVHWGGITFAFRFVPPAQALPNPFWKDLDLQYVNLLLMSIFFHLALIVTFMVYPHDTESLREDIFDKPGVIALLLEPPKMDESTKNKLEEMKKKQERDKEKIVQKEEKKKPEKVKERTPTKINDVQVKQVPREKSQADKQREVSEKFSKLFTGGTGGGQGSLLGGGGGGTLSGTLSNVIGTTGAGTAGGLAGLGIRGGSMTGGGIGTSRGIAGIGTAGRLGGGGNSYGSNVGKGLGGPKDRGMVSLSTPVVMGALPREVIQKVINDNKAQIRYCYEIELQRDQTLEGKVAVKWIIAATGAVEKVVVTETTIKSARVGQCLAEKIKGWRFPQPAGGGIVEVNYPFVFKSS